MESAWRMGLWLAGLVVVSLGVYLVASANTYRSGFPLDDAWIHQTYARNLAQNREWAFLPGQPSAGSTAPLWSGLLSIGHALGLGPYGWTYLLGGILLWGLAWQGSEFFRYLCPECSNWRLAAGVLLAFEWHMVWAAASGMEILLYAWIILFVLTKLVGGWEHWFTLGVLIGVSVWVRPDGLTLLGPAVFVIALRSVGLRCKLYQLGRLAAGFISLVLPYGLFNRWLSGSWLPNTFFAKQAEYAIELHSPLLSRLSEQAFLPLVGVGALLLPGFLIYLYLLFRQRKVEALASAFWFIGYLILYAVRLPVTYQHGRYLQPAMPIYFLLGFAGLVFLVLHSRSTMLQRILYPAWLYSAVLVLVIFWAVGANAYRQDVAVIESEMVDTALWVAENTSPDSWVAAHDIGAIGYFAQRPLVDLAGLVSPEVIGFIRDEARLSEFLDDQRVSYLVTFPGWYPELVKGKELVYQGHAPYSPAAGGEHMSVYRWSK